MREESHLDDMRAAIRGDFERLAERRGGQELMSAPAEYAGEAGEPDAPAEPTAPPAAPLPEPVPGEAPPEAAAPPEEEEAPEPAGAPEDEPELAEEALVEASEEPSRRSWLARLLGR